VPFSGDKTARPENEEVDDVVHGNADGFYLILNIIKWRVGKEGEWRDREEMG
jgi:hypothetical protein